jgi:uncharacterized LabA/DUF88 family protein
MAELSTSVISTTSAFWREFQSRGALMRAFLLYRDHGRSRILVGSAPIDWLSYNGYTVVTKAIKEFDASAAARRRAT